MKRYIILIMIFIFSVSCKKEFDVVPNTIETITLKIKHDTSIVFFNNQTFILDASTGNPSSTYFWDGPINSSSPIVTITNPFVLPADSYNSQYCTLNIITDTTHSKITVYFIYDSANLYYPNSFSPNGDFIDDYWYPCGVNISQDNYSLKIYNNDERLLFKIDNINKNRWDGIVDGEKCPVGYYYYVVKYQDLSGHKLKNSGMFQLIR